MPRKEWLAKQTPEKKAELARKNKEYRKTPAGLKMNRVSTWKSNGIISDDWNATYERYINTKLCECCNNKFKSSMDKHLDHCHQTGKVRYVLCRNCNQLKGHIDKDYKLIMKLLTM